MEAFESFVALALEGEGFAVSSGVKFTVARQTRKTSRVEVQAHGYEVDLVGARADRLVLASVKSFFGSAGVKASEVLAAPDAKRPGGYRLLNDHEIRKAVVRQAAERYGYRTRQVEMRLYAGRFRAPSRGEDERRVREWAANQRVGAGPIQVVDLHEVVATVLREAERKQYVDNPVLVTIKVLREAGVDLSLDA